MLPIVSENIFGLKFKVFLKTVSKKISALNTFILFDPNMIDYVIYLSLIHTFRGPSDIQLYPGQMQTYLQNISYISHPEQ